MRPQIQFPLIVALAALLGLGASRNFAVDIDLIGGSGLKIGGTAVIDSSRAATVSALVSTGAISGTTGTLSFSDGTSNILGASLTNTNTSTTGSYAGYGAMAQNSTVTGSFLAIPTGGVISGGAIALRSVTNHPIVFLLNGNNEKLRVGVDGAMTLSGTLTAGAATVSALASTGALTATTGTFSGGLSASQSHVRVEKTGDQTLATTWTVYKITFTTEHSDVLGDFANSTFTAPVAGTYLLTAAVRFTSSGASAGSRVSTFARIGPAGTNLSLGSLQFGGTANALDVCGSVVVVLAAADTLEVHGTASYNNAVVGEIVSYVTVSRLP